MINLAIDLGRYSVKFITEAGEKISFPSVLGEGKEFVDIYSNGSTESIEYNGLSYIYGNTALEQASFLDHSRDAKWVGEKSFLVLTLAAISQITTAVNPKISIVTGLPHSDYKSGYKARIIETLAGTHTIKSKGPVQHIEILPPSIYTQSLGAIWSWSLDDNGNDIRDLSGKRIGVINAGSQTTEMLTLYFDGQRPTIIEDATRSVDSGFWKAAEALKDQTNIADEFLADARLQNPSGQLERAIIGDYCNSLLKQCDQNWGAQKRRSVKENIDTFLVCGGRGQMVYGYLSNFGWHKDIVLLPNPQWATVMGYQKFAKRRIK